MRGRCHEGIGPGTHHLEQRREVDGVGEVHAHAHGVGGGVDDRGDVALGVVEGEVGERLDGRAVRADDVEVEGSRAVGVGVHRAHDYLERSALFQALDVHRGAEGTIGRREGGRRGGVSGLGVRDPNDVGDRATVLEEAVDAERQHGPGGEAAVELLELRPARDETRAGALGIARVVVRGTLGEAHEGRDRGRGRRQALLRRGHFLHVDPRSGVRRHDGSPFPRPRAVLEEVHSLQTLTHSTRERHGTHARGPPPQAICELASERPGDVRPAPSDVNETLRRHRSDRALPQDHSAWPIPSTHTYLPRDVIRVCGGGQQGVVNCSSMSLSYTKYVCVSDTVAP